MRYKLRPQIKILLIIIGIIITGILMTYLIKDYNERMEAWYSECDNYYGFKTSYYQCNIYHLGND